jgi:hypothetical protein
MEEPKRPSLILHAVVGAPLGIVGLIASVIWYYHVSRDDGALAGFAKIGPLLLGLCSLIVTTWALLIVITIIKTAKEQYEDEDI